MKLKDLLNGYNGEFSELQIEGITCDSREVKSGYAFVCINGALVDGHRFANDANGLGASVIISERDLGLSNQIVIDDTHTAFADMCANWFNKPAESLKLIAVTGTNGKTSITYMLKSILETAGNKVGLIGTIQNMIGDEVLESHNTTPGPYELNSLFAQMRDKGCSYAIMEVSSHALDQNRVYNLNFETAIFTNLTRDHLDYHKTMENYLAAKKKLFYMCKTAVINADDSYAQKLMEGLNCEVVTYSTGNMSDYSAKSINYRPTSVDYRFVGKDIMSHITVNTGGRFTVYNSLAVAVAALVNGVSPETIVEGLKKINGVKGRNEVVPNNRGFSIIIDYAHTPDGLKNILTSFNDCEKNRLIVLFGCGGDRDKTKRPIMGNIAVHNADYVIVTSDNPRSEEPMSIIGDILEGTKSVNTPVKVIENRIEAIKYAISMAKPDDIIVLAGKGHETYQILKDKTIHLDEREVIAEALEELK